MEEPVGTTLNQVVGISVRTNHTGRQEPVSESFFSHADNVVRAFSSFPIAKHFGLNPKTAMELPLDQWYQICDTAKQLAANPPEDSQTQMLMLMREILEHRREGGE